MLSWDFRSCPTETSWVERYRCGTRLGILVLPCWFGCKPACRELRVLNCLLERLVSGDEVGECWIALIHLPLREINPASAHVSSERVEVLAPLLHFVGTSPNEKLFRLVLLSPRYPCWVDFCRGKKSSFEQGLSKSWNGLFQSSWNRDTKTLGGSCLGVGQRSLASSWGPGMRQSLDSSCTLGQR